MSGRVRITSEVAESASRHVAAAQEDIDGCRGGGPTEVDAGEVTDVIAGAVEDLISQVEGISTGLDGFVDRLNQTVSTFETTDQDVADGAQAQAWSE